MGSPDLELIVRLAEDLLTQGGEHGGASTGPPPSCDLGVMELLDRSQVLTSVFTTR